MKISWWRILLNFALKLLGISCEAESPTAQAERLTRAAERAQAERDTAARAAAANTRKTRMEHDLNNIAQAAQEKGKGNGNPLIPGKPLLCLLVALTLASGCFEKRPPAQLPDFQIVCPELPAVEKPIILTPEPNADGLYCFTETDVKAWVAYTKTLLAIQDTYNAERAKP